MPTNPKYRVFVNAQGEYLHEACLAKDDIRANLQEVDLNEISVTDECGECSGEFLAEALDDDDYDEDDED